MNRRRLFGIIPAVGVAALWRRPAQAHSIPVILQLLMAEEASRWDWGHKLENNPPQPSEWYTPARIQQAAREATAILMSAQDKLSRLHALASNPQASIQVMQEYQDYYRRRLQQEREPYYAAIFQSRFDALTTFIDGRGG